MIFQKAHSNDFDRIKNFYWDLIDEMQDQNDVIGWKKGIYTHGRVPAGESAAGRTVHADPSRIRCSACTAGQGRRTARGGRNPAIRKSKRQKGGAAGHSRTDRRRGKAVHKMRLSVRTGQNDVLRGHRLD